MTRANEPGGSPSDPAELTLLLERASAGDESAHARLLPLIYDELRSLARHYMRGQLRAHSLQPTDLVHEAYLKIAGGNSRLALQSRTHFLAVAARAMRHILVDHARRKGAERRGGRLQRVTLSDLLGIGPERSEHQVDVLDLDRALEKLSALHERQARVVELRFFAGMTIAEAASMLGVSTDTVEDDTAVARTWLRRELREC